jgi:uncharacterized protein YbjT (DUF2867 family)
MRVLLLGASGLIGSAVAARLVAQGHSIVAISRQKRWTLGLFPVSEAVIDIASATKPGQWRPHLDDIDAVVNCAGVLQDSPRDSTQGVHIAGVAALFLACEQANVRRVVHISAVGVDRHGETAFSRSKRVGEQALMARNLDWVILQPSVVVGRAAYGGSALIRGLAALPVAPVISNTAPLQIVHLDDLVETIIFFLKPDAPSRMTIEIVGPKEWRLDAAVALFRSWLRWPPAATFRVPHWLAEAMLRLGDAASLLGWRPPMRSTAGQEMMRGATGDPSDWMRLTGIVPRDLKAALAAEPASVQERWFARLYLLKPVVLVVLSVFWTFTGIISLGPGYETAKRLLEEGGMAELAGASVIAGAVADILTGIGIIIRPIARVALYAALALAVFYAIIGTILFPYLWFDPLGPIAKIAVVLALQLVALAILDER